MLRQEAKIRLLRDDEDGWRVSDRWVWILCNIYFKRGIVTEDWRASLHEG